MADYRIITDSSCDLTALEIQELNIPVVSLSLNIQGKSICPTEEDYKSIYAALRAGENATTSAANPDEWMGAMEPVLKEGKDLLVMAFSSGLSTTYQSAVIAADTLLEKYPDRKILVSDTLCASRGQGMLVWYAAEKQNGGMDLETLYRWVEDNKLHLCHWFTVDDLMFLKRGGRVSATTALVGGMLNIKPVLFVDNEGHLIKAKTARGRRASLDALVKMVEETGYPEEISQEIFICHGDCLEDAQYTAEKCREKFGTKNVRIGYTGAVIGAHSGPGTVAIFYLGKHR